MNKKLSLIAVVILAATSNVDCMRAAASRAGQNFSRAGRQLNKLVTERPYPAMAAALAAGAGAGIGLAYNRDRIMAAMRSGIATAHKRFDTQGISILPKYARDAEYVKNEQRKVEEAEQVKAVEAELIRKANEAVPQKLDSRIPHISNGKVIINELDHNSYYADINNKTISRVWDPSTNQVIYEGDNIVMDVLPNGNLVVSKAKQSPWFKRDFAGDRIQYAVIQIVDPVTNKVLFDTKEIPKGKHSTQYEILDDRVATWVSKVSNAVDILDHDGIKLAKLKHPTDPKKFRVEDFDVVPGEGFAVTFTNPNVLRGNRAAVFERSQKLFDENGNFLRNLYIENANVDDSGNFTSFSTSGERV